MGVAITVWFCLLLSGWRVLGRLVTLPEDRVAFVAVGVCAWTCSRPPQCRTCPLSGRQGSARGGVYALLGSGGFLGTFVWALSWRVRCSAHEMTGYLPGGCGRSGADTGAGGRASWQPKRWGGAPFLFWTAGHMSASRSFVSLCSWCYICTLGAPMLVRLALPWIGLAPGKRL